jgi:hypothetical protein
MYRVQQNITLSAEQQQILIDNIGKVDNVRLSKMVGVGYGKLVSNIKVMGLASAKVDSEVSFDNNGMFDADKFFNFYNY